MKRVLIISLTLNIFLFSCSSQEEQKPVQKQKTVPVIYVSNYPLKYFSERIGSPLVEIKFPAAVSPDPAYWQPVAEDVTAMQQADLIILNGASYEKWLKNVTLPSSKVVETAAGFEDQFIPLQETVTHSHGLEGAHEHSGTAFTTWLDMSLAVQQAKSVKEALIARFPDHKGYFEDRFIQLEKDLLALDEELKGVAKNKPAKPVFFSHPVYQYLEKRYGINGKSVHWEAEEMPDSGMWAEFKSIREHHPAQWMIWESEPAIEIVEKLETMDVQSVVFDPCGNEPQKGDFLSVMKANVQTLRQIYE